tara:strand:- start:20 stop:967 length:948 start_codon:yes stop_codon:yes gene_type:complete
MFGSFAKRIWSEDYPWAPMPEQRQKDYDFVEREWGNEMDLEHYVPSKVNDAAFARRLATYFRRAASPGAAVTLLKMNTQIDISNVLPAIHVPTLILHRTGDRDANIEEGRWMAERIPSAIFKELPGEDHFPWVGDQETILGEVQEFLTGAQPTGETRPALATIMFTDIVGSTEILQKLGDDAWRILLEKHDRISFDSIEKARGRLVNKTGDGVVAAFDGPSRAISCAREIIKRAGELGLEIRSGLHTGECEIRGKETIGLAVHLAARVVPLAGTGEVLVSQTVRDLVSGSRFEFEDRDRHVLKGFPEKWRLFSVR